MKSKTRFVTFNTNFQLTRLYENLQKTCDLSLTFSVCQKYLTLPPLQLVPEAYFIRSLAACLQHFLLVQCFLYPFGDYLAYRPSKQTEYSFPLDKICSQVGQNKLNIRFHWIKSICRLVYNILGFVKKKPLPLVFFYHYMESIRLFYQRTILSRLFVIKH